MSTDSSGNYTLPSADIVNGQTGDATPVQANFDDLEAGLTERITKTGKTTYTANQPMGGFKLTTLGAATARGDSANAAQVQDGTLSYILTTGTDTILATLSPAIAAYTVGAKYRLKKSAAANTGAVTINFNGLGAGAATWTDGTAMANGDLPADSHLEVIVASATPTFHVTSVTKAPLARSANLLDVASVPTSRANLKVDSRTAVADAAYAVLSADYLVAYTSISAARSVTLPAANTFNAGRRLVIVDESGSASATNTISLVPNGTDTIAGSNTTQVIINIPRGRIELECNGTNGWHVIGEWCVRYSAILGADVSLTNIGTYFDTVSVAQGPVGTWRSLAKATVTSGGIANANGKLWDATSVIDSGRQTVAGTNQAHMITMLGDITNPAGNIKVSINDATRTDGTVKFNFSGDSKDTSLLVWRIA